MIAHRSLLEFLAVIKYGAPNREQHDQAQCGGGHENCHALVYPPGPSVDDRLLDLLFDELALLAIAVAEGSVVRVKSEVLR